MTITAKTRTLAKYVSSPSSYPFLVRLVRTKLLGGSMDLNDTAGESKKWCASLAVETKVALQQLGFLCIDPAESFSDIYKGSVAAVDQCPQEMGGGGNSVLLHSLVVGSNAQCVIETGVAYGWSSLAILLGLQDQDGGRLFSSNLHYPKFDGDEQYVGCAVPTELRGKWTLIPQPDAEAIPKILEQTNVVDIIHYDSSKSYAGRLATYPTLWNALRVGGLFVSDDIDDNVGFMHFCKMLRVRPIIVETPQPDGKPTKYVGVIMKEDDRVPRKIMF